MTVPLPRAHGWREVTAYPIHLGGKFWCVSAFIRGLSRLPSPDPVEIEGHEVEGVDDFAPWLDQISRAEESSEYDVLELLNERLLARAEMELGR